jgi:hypothetical protein
MELFCRPETGVREKNSRGSWSLELDLAKPTLIDPSCASTFPGRELSADEAFYVSVIE